MEFNTLAGYIQYHWVGLHSMLLHVLESYQTTVIIGMLVAILIHLWLYVEVWLEFNFFFNIFGNFVLEDVVILVYAVITLLFVTWESAALFLRDHRFRGLPGSSPHCTQGCFTHVSATQRFTQRVTN